MGNNLYGKFIDKKGNEYLEIKYENKYLVCNYTKWNGKNIVNITQIDLKNRNIKIDRKEKTEYTCPDNKNETKIEELEKNWYISNGSIINYKLAKHYLDSQSELKECYSICPKSYSEGHVICYDFTSLDENLFKLFMTSQITIQQLLEQNQKKENNKKKIK